jgi:hypothetical protein
MPEPAWHGTIRPERNPDVDQCRGSARNLTPVPGLAICLWSHRALIEVTIGIADEWFRLRVAEHLDALQFRAAGA